jgi:hypothetical protein
MRFFEVEMMNNKLLGEHKEWWREPVKKDVRRKGEVKVELSLFLKAYRGKRGILVAQLILNLGSRWWWRVNFMPQLLCPWERTPVPMKQEAGLTQSWSGCCG